jgi:hypothetical protein
LLRIPPDRPVSAFGIDDDRCVGAVGHGGAVGMMQVLASMRIAGMPAVDNQSRRAGPEVADVPVECVELVYESHPMELQ